MINSNLSRTKKSDSPIFNKNDNNPNLADFQNDNMNSTINKSNNTAETSSNNYNSNQYIHGQECFLSDSFSDDEFELHNSTTKLDVNKDRRIFDNRRGNFTGMILSSDSDSFSSNNEEEEEEAEFDESRECFEGRDEIDSEEKDYDNVNEAFNLNNITNLIYIIMPNFLELLRNRQVLQLRS